MPVYLPGDFMAKFRARWFRGHKNHLHGPGAAYSMGDAKDARYFANWLPAKVWSVKDCIMSGERDEKRT